MSRLSPVPALLGPDLIFPSADRATPDGLVAVGGDFTIPRLLLAYRSGIFPWTSHPPTWWSPDPRGIFELGGMHVSRSLQRTLKRGVFQVTVDRAFREVMLGCTEPRPGRGGAWITPTFVRAYTALHQAGHAHSVECWLDGQLAGGIYGVAVGGLFAGESMFHRVSDASKVALVNLEKLLRQAGFLLFDIQMVTPITTALGAVEIPRAEYLRRVRAAVDEPRVFPRSITS